MASPAPDWKRGQHRPAKLNESNAISIEVMVEFRGPPRDAHLTPDEEQPLEHETRKRSFIKFSEELHWLITAFQKRTDPVTFTLDDVVKD